MTIAPLSAVFEHNGERELIQPWVDHTGDTSKMQGNRLNNATARPSLAPIADYPAQIIAALGDLLVGGLHHSDDRTAARWRRLAADGAGRGFVRLSDAVERVADGLARKMHVLDWDWHTTAEGAIDLAVLARFASEQ